MAKYYKGILGPISGKVGELVFSSRNGVNYVRRVAKHTHKTPSTKQLIHRKKFGILALCLVMCLPGISVTPLNAQAVNAGYKYQAVSDIQAKVRQIYTSQLGVREKQPNSGPAVNQYLRYVNLTKANPWCAAFVCWVYGQAEVENPRSGWSPDLFPARKVIWTKEGTKIKEQSHPLSKSYTYSRNPDKDNLQFLTPGTGDVFGIFFPEKNRIAHVGFIDQWDGTWITSVEGNTNLKGSREGDGVYRKRRLVRSIYRVARYIKSN